MSTDSFPRLAARTMNFRLGLPRGFTVSPDGGRVLFLRSPDGTTRAHSLWSFDVASGRESLLADPAVLIGGGDEALTPEERARRERLRVTTSGVTAYSTDRDAHTVAFALASRLFVRDLTGEAPARELPTVAPVIDPQLDPTGRRVAYAGDRALHVVDLRTGVDEVLVGPEPDEPTEVAWGLAEFIAGEELDRGHGFWWAPDGESLVVERYDESGVLVWHISDPARPEREPVRVRYPRAGTANAVVGLAVVGVDGRRTDVDWRSDRDLDGTTLEYLVDVTWSGARPVVALLTRDQRRLEYRELDPTSGTTTLLRATTDDHWVERLPGTPRRLADGRLLHAVDTDDARQLWLDDAPFTPADTLVRGVVAVEDDGVLAEIVPQLGSVALAHLSFAGGVDLLSDPDGVAGGATGGGTVVVAQQQPTTLDVEVVVRRDGAEVGRLHTATETSPLRPEVTTFLTDSGTAVSVLFPTGHVRGSGRLPVLLDPYGGPHGQRVVNAARAHLTSQWFADQGFLVVVADGRGTAGRGPAWDRRAWHDRAGTADDQAEAARAVAARYPDDVDPTRVAVRGWSFGGYLAALCVLRHPDVFAAAIAGAPTTDERLYDTCYSERYLGHPDTDGDVYDANSLIPIAGSLQRPLMMIHGLADDNVHVAHSLQLSGALLAAGRPHEVLPLSGVTHLATDEVTAENLLLLQVDFLRRSLRIAAPGA